MPMDRILRLTVVALVLVAIEGCWSFNESVPPKVSVTAAPEQARQKRIALAGFETSLTEYLAVHGYQTIYVPGGYGGWRCHPGYVETVPSTAYVPQQRLTDVFYRRAQDLLDQAGYSISLTPADADFVVDVRFEGPYFSQGDASRALAWNLCTLFFCDFVAVEWRAKMRIRDVKSGRLACTRDFAQRCERNAFGIIPIFGIAGCSETSHTALQVWCLSVLTDRALADATSFLSK